MKRISSKKALLIFYGFDIILVLVLLLLFLPLSKKKYSRNFKNEIYQQCQRNFFC